MMATGRMKTWLFHSVCSDLDAAINWVREKSRPSNGEVTPASGSLPRNLNFIDNGTVFQIAYKRATRRLALLYINHDNGTRASMHDGETGITIRLDHLAAGPSGSTQQVVDMLSSSTGYSLELHDFNVIVRLDDHDEGDIYLRVFSCEIATAEEEVRREREPFPDLPELGEKPEIQKRVNMLREVRKAAKENASSSQRSSKSNRSRGTAISQSGGLDGLTQSQPFQDTISQTLQFQTQLPIASQMTTSNPKKRTSDDLAILGGVNLAPPRKPRQHVPTTADTVPSNRSNLLALLHQQPTKSFGRTTYVTVHNPTELIPADKVPHVLSEARSLHGNAPQSPRHAEPPGQTALDDEARLIGQQPGLVNDTRSFATQIAQDTEMSNSSQPSAAVTSPGVLRDTMHYSGQKRRRASIPAQDEQPGVLRSAEMSGANKPKGITGRHTRSFEFIEAFENINDEVDNCYSLDNMEDQIYDQIPESLEAFVEGKVPDKQQRILRRPESVYSPRMSRPFPQGNIPIAIFRRIIAEMPEARSEATTAHQEAATSTTVQDNTAEDDDEEEEPLSGWDESSPVRSRDFGSPLPESSSGLRAEGVSSYSQASQERLSPKAKNSAPRLNDKDSLPFDSSAPAPDLPSSPSSSPSRSPASQPRHTDDPMDVSPSLQNTLSSSLAVSNLSRPPQHAETSHTRNSSPIACAPVTRRESQSSDIEMERPQALPTPTPMSTTSVRSRVPNDTSGEMRGLLNTGSATSERARQAVSALETPVVSKLRSSAQALSASQPSPYSTATTSTTATSSHAASQQPRQHSLSIRSAASDRSSDRQRASWNSHFPITPIPTFESSQSSPVQLVPGTFNSSDRRAFDRAPLAFAIDGNVDDVPPATRKASTVASASGAVDKGMDHVKSSSQKKSKKRLAVEEPSREPGSELLPKRHKFDFDRPSQVEDPIEANRRMKKEFEQAAKAKLKKTDVQPARTDLANGETRKRPYEDRASNEVTPSVAKSTSSHPTKPLPNQERQSSKAVETKDSEIGGLHESPDDVQHEHVSKRPKLHDRQASVQHDSVSISLAERNKPSASSTHAIGAPTKQRELQPQHAVKEVVPPLRTSGSGGVDIARATADQPAIPVLGKSSVHAIPAADAPQRGASRVFSDFQAAYPVYCGDIKHFQGLCRMIKRLNISHGLLHRSLWDDFVIRHRRDYTLYMVQCLQGGEAVKAYEAYYQEDIEEPSYTLRVLTPQTLEEVLTDIQPGEAAPLLQQVPQQQTVLPPFLAHKPQSTSVGVPPIESRQASVVHQPLVQQATRSSQESSSVQMSGDHVEDSVDTGHLSELAARPAPVVHERESSTGSTMRPSNPLQPKAKVGKPPPRKSEAVDLTKESHTGVTAQPASAARLGSVPSHASSVKDVSTSSKAKKQSIAPSAESKPDQVKQPKRKLMHLSSPTAPASSSAATTPNRITVQPSGTGRKGPIAAASKPTPPAVAKSTSVPTSNNTTRQPAGMKQPPRNVVASTTLGPGPPIEPKRKTNPTTSDAAQQRAKAPVPAGPALAVVSPQTKTQTAPAQNSRPAKPAASGMAPAPTQLRNSNMVLPKPASAPVAVGSTINKPYSVNHCMICGATGHWMSNCPVSHGKMLAKEEARQAMVNATTKRAVRRDPNYDTGDEDQDETVPPLETVDPAVPPPRVTSTSAQDKLSKANIIPTGPRNPGKPSQRSAQGRDKQHKSQAQAHHDDSDDDGDGDTRMAGLDRSSDPTKRRQWWQDENTPFNEFARNFMGARTYPFAFGTASGNAFSMARAQKDGETAARHGLDLLAWRF